MQHSQSVKQPIGLVLTRIQCLPAENYNFVIYHINFVSEVTVKNGTFYLVAL